jgi:uncharacterized membrane protein YoaK (UPF0700 family)
MDSRTSEPLMEQPFVALLLALSGGVLSGFTYATVHLYSTVQSGNVVLVGYALETGANTQWRNAVIAIACFGLGSATTALLQNLMSEIQKDYSPVVLAIEAVALGLLGFSFMWDRWEPLTYAFIVSFLAGMQGNAFHRVDGFLYGNIAVTLVVQQAFNHLIQAMFRNRRSHLTQSGIFFCVLVAFAAGGYVGAWGTHEFESGVLWLAAVLLGFLALMGALRQRRKEPVDISYQ